MSDQDIETIQASFDQDRRDYWAMREQLLVSYRGKWVAVHKGHVCREMWLKRWTNALILIILP
jgi:hypothetical protein